MEVDEMKSEKWLKKIAVICFIPMILGLLGVIVQTVAPMLFRKNEYMGMVMDSKTVIGVFVTAFVINILITFVWKSKIPVIQNTLHKVSGNKGERIGAIVLSSVFALLSSLIIITSVTSSIVIATNTKTLNGTVEDVVVTTSSRDGNVTKLIIIEDDKGKQYKMYKNKNLKNLDLSKNDSVQVDYSEVVNTTVGEPDGNILGYTAHAKNTK